MAINILITSAGGVMAENLFYYIKKNTNYKFINIHATDSKKIKKKLRYISSFTRVPKAKSINYAKKIKNILKKKSINILIPGSDEEAQIISKKKKYIENSGTTAACLEYKYLKKFENKENTYRNIDKTNLRKPIWIKVKNFNQLKTNVSKMFKIGKDVVIKPVFSRGGRDIVILKKNLKNKIIYKNFKKEIHLSKEKFYRNISSFKKKYKNKFPLIIMERLYEPYYDIDLLSWKGKMIKYIARKRIGPQGIHGNIVEKNNKKFSVFLKKIAKTFNLSWLYDCDVMFNNNSEPVLMELNPRISGTLYASLAAKNNLIDDLISISKNNFSKIKKVNIKKNLIVRPQIKFKN